MAYCCKSWVQLWILELWREGNCSVQTRGSDLCQSLILLYDVLSFHQRVCFQTCLSWLGLPLHLYTFIDFGERKEDFWRSRNCSCITSIHSLLLTCKCSSGYHYCNSSIEFLIEFTPCQNHLKSKLLKSLNKNSHKFLHVVLLGCVYLFKKSIWIPLEAIWFANSKAKAHQPSKTSCELVLPFQSISYCIMLGDIVLIICARIYRVWQGRKSKFAVPGFFFFFFLLCSPLYCK